MNMKRHTFIFIISIITVLCFGCSGNKQRNKSDNSLRRTIIEEFENMKSQLPMHIQNSPIIMEDVSVDGDMVAFVIDYPKDFWEENFYLGSDIANSDKNVARMLNNISKEQIGKFIKAGLGFKFIYKSLETGESLLTIEADNERLSRVQHSMTIGEIVPYTVMEILQMEIDKYELPCEIEDGLWMTDAYIRGNTVCYIATFESDITSNDLSYSDISELKEDIIEGLKESLVDVAHKKEMSKNNIRIIYVYKNNDGDEFARIEITAADL